MTHLVEIIDGSLAVPYKKISDLAYEFQLPDTEYSYVVTFAQDGNSVEVTFKVFNASEGIAKEGSHDRIDLGMKLAARVFHTVWKIIENFLDTTLDPIDYLLFGARNTEPSRIRFYRTLSQRLAKAYGQDPADIVEAEDSFRDKASRQTIFTVPVFVDAAS
jgi:hypothetical protein